MIRTYFLCITLLAFFTLAWTVGLLQYLFESEFHLLISTNLLNSDERPIPATFLRSGTSWTLSGIRIVNKRFHADRSFTAQGSQSAPKKAKIHVPEPNYIKEDYQLVRYILSMFKKDWCRVNQAKLDWNRYLSSCANHTKWRPKYAQSGVENRTNAANSFIFNWEIRPAGEFSKFYIQSKTLTNRTKYFGGDSWRIRINGVASVSPTVFDHNNGSYEVLFLLMEAGIYHIQIVLDYSLCDGFKDPPADWYKKGTYQGKNQPDGRLLGDRPYLMQPLGDGKPISIKVMKPNYGKNIHSRLEQIRRKIFSQKYTDETFCNLKCPSLIWDGLGRWTNATWNPFVEDLLLKHEPHKRQGVLWIYGDSVSNMFKESLETGKFYEICGKIFKLCKVTYSWVYNLKNNTKEPEKEKLPDGEDYNHNKVLAEIKRVLQDKAVDEHSVILLNWGIHFAAAVNFSNYQRLIDDFIRTVTFEKRRGVFKGKIIWRTTTAIFRERYSNPHKDARRFLTFPRILLYNAYAMSAMCRAGIDIIDVYPMSYSFPPGTLSKNDPVHYEARAFESVEELIHRKFKSIK